MTDHLLEEQEMEAEALAAIFPDAFEIRSSTQPFVWSIKLVPIDTGGDEELDEKQNYVGVRLVATIPLNYPEEVGPELDIEIIKGLAEEQRNILLDLALATAEANMGMPSIFSCCEAVREWLFDNNVKGQDDGSMYAQMMRKAKELEKSKMLATQQYESQKVVDEMTEAEKEEQEVRKRREEGTPVNDTTFAAWKRQFEAEMAEIKARERALAEKEALAGGGKKTKIGIKREESALSERLTGFEQFSGKAGILAMEALEKEAELEERFMNLEVDEELFEDEEDLDDLDFDDETASDDSYDENDEELDI